MLKIYFLFLILIISNSVGVPKTESAPISLLYACSAQYTTCYEDGFDCNEVRRTSDSDGEDKSEDEEKLDDIIDSLLEQFDLTELEDFFNEYSSLFGDGLSLSDKIKAVITGDLKTDYSSLFSLFLNAFTNCTADFLPSISIICILSCFCGLLSALDFGRAGGTKDAVFLVTFLLVTIILFSEMNRVIKGAISSLTTLTKQMQAVFPLLFALVTVSGGESSVGVFKPAAVFLTGGVSSLVVSVLVPLLSAIAVAVTVGNLSEKNGLKKLKDFLCSCFKWLLGGAAAIFSIFLSVQGIAASVYDGVAVRALKYALGNSVPIVGNFVSGGVDLVLCGAVLIKNSVGGVVILLMFTALLSPLLTVICLSLLLKLLSALCEPLADGRICEMISGYSTVLSYLAALIVVVFVLYFVTVLLIILTGRTVI